jgi:hypothetical protein
MFMIAHSEEKREGRTRRSKLLAFYEYKILSFFRKKRM